MFGGRLRLWVRGTSPPKFLMAQATIPVVDLHYCNAYFFFLHPSIVFARMASSRTVRLDDFAAALRRAAGIFLPTGMPSSRCSLPFLPPGLNGFLLPATARPLFLHLLALLGV